MKVAIITRDYPPKIGGIATHTEGIVKHLRKKGVKVDVFAGYTDFVTITIPLRYSLRGYDIVNVQSTPYAPFIMKRPLVLTAIAPLTMEWSYYNLPGLLRVPPAYLLERLSIRNATLITAISRATKEELVKRYGLEDRRIEVIPSGVDCERYLPMVKDESSKAKILICSRLEPRKNTIEALRALSKIGQNLFEATVVGEGSDRRYLEEYARRHLPSVRFTGAVNEEELPLYYGSANIFISTSFSEGFGLSVLQALASGCAVIASKIPAHRELIENMVNGVIYSTHDELVYMLNTLVNDPGLADRLGRNGRELALGYSFGKIAEMTLDLYEELLP